MGNPHLGSVPGPHPALPRVPEEGKSARSKFSELVVEGGGGAGAFVEGVEVELFVGAVDAVVGEAETDEDRVDAEGGFEEGADGDGAALADEDGGDAEAGLDGGFGEGHGLGVDREEAGEGAA